MLCAVECVFVVEVERIGGLHLWQTISAVSVAFVFSKHCVHSRSRTI